MRETKSNKLSPQMLQEILSTIYTEDEVINIMNNFSLEFNRQLKSADNTMVTKFAMSLIKDGNSDGR